MLGYYFKKVEPCNYLNTLFIFKLLTLLTFYPTFDHSSYLKFLKGYHIFCYELV
jgi:hypothetical protein